MLRIRWDPGSAFLKLTSKSVNSILIGQYRENLAERGTHVRQSRLVSNNQNFGRRIPEKHFFYVNVNYFAIELQHNAIIQLSSFVFAKYIQIFSKN